MQNYVYPWATFGREPLATKLKAAPDELIPIFEEKDINVVVVGGETNGYWQIMGAKLPQDGLDRRLALTGARAAKPCAASSRDTTFRWRSSSSLLRWRSGCAIWDSPMAATTKASTCRR